MEFRTIEGGFILWICELAPGQECAHLPPPAFADGLDQRGIAMIREIVERSRFAVFLPHE